MGVNKYQPENPEQVEVLIIDNEQVRNKQIEKIRRVKETRDAARVEQCLNALTQCASDASGGANLLGLAVEAALARCTVGEITQAMEKVFGRHVAHDTMISGAYKSEYVDQKELEIVNKKVMETTILETTLGDNSNDYPSLRWKSS